MTAPDSGLGASALLPGIRVRVLMSLPPQVTRMAHPAFRSAIEEMHRRIFILSVYVDPDSKKDLRATFVRFENT